MENTSEQIQRTVQDYIASIDDVGIVQDTHALSEMMRRISGHEPVLLNVGTLGFDSFHYRYESGREGDCHVLGFYPRKGKITIYLMDGTARYADLLAALGKHSTSRVCLYIKRLCDVDMAVLEQVLQQSYEHVKSMDGQMQRIQ